MFDETLGKYTDFDYTSQTNNIHRFVSHLPFAEFHSANGE